MKKKFLLFLLVCALLLPCLALGESNSAGCPHTDTFEIPGKHGNCTSEGSPTVIWCMNCFSEISSSTTNTGHCFIKYASNMDPTCTEDGSTEGIRCTRCLIIQKEAQVIKRLDHKWSAWTIADGRHSRVCLRCNKPDVNVCTDETCAYCARPTMSTTATRASRSDTSAKASVLAPVILYEATDVRIKGGMQMTLSNRGGKYEVLLTSLPESPSYNGTLRVSLPANLFQDCSLRDVTNTDSPLHIPIRKEANDRVSFPLRFINGSNSIEITFTLPENNVIKHLYLFPI